MILTFESTPRGLEIHENGNFVAEVAREDEGIDIVNTYNNAKSLCVIEFQHKDSTEWGISTNGCNPSDNEFYAMPKETAFRLVSFFAQTYSDGKEIQCFRASGIGE